jgi:hypothetical protein
LRASPPQTTKKYRPLRVLSAQIGDGWYSLIGGCVAENIYFSKVPRFGFAVRIQSSRQNQSEQKKMSKLYLGSSLLESRRCGKQR